MIIIPFLKSFAPRMMHGYVRSAQDITYDKVMICINAPNSVNVVKLTAGI